MRRLPAMIAGAVALGVCAVAPSSASGCGTDGWKSTPAAPYGCDVPHHPAGGSDTASAVYLGDTRTDPRPGCDPSWVVCEFECDAGDSSGGYCTATFDASMWLVAGERAALVLAAGGAVVAREIPGSRGGQKGRYAASIRANRRVTLVFAVWHAPQVRAGTRSLLSIETVDLYWTPEDITSPSLAPLHLDAIPFDPRTLSGDPPQRVAGPTDCNGNDLPDSYEVTQGMTPDRDGDGLPDDCQDKREIDWVLLTLGVLILSATLIRLAVKNRSANT